MITAAISDSVAFPLNSSMALTSDVVTTTLESNQHLDNSTGYLIEQDELQYNILAAFSDIQTVVLACIFTLLPLIFAVAIAFGMRHAWRKYRHRGDSMSDLPWYHGVPTRGNTSAPLHSWTNSPGLGIQSATRILSAHDLADGLGGPRLICDTGLLGEKVLVAGNNEFSSPVNNLCKNRNGSIITLKLQNNHLIVETAEQLESADDNSFVVEMEPKYTENGINIDARLRNDSRENVTDQFTLVHRDEIADRSAEFETTWRFGEINTGLSQSDLSISSNGSFNRGYCYGNQLEYETGQFDDLFAPAIEKDERIVSRKLVADSKLVEFEDTPATAGIPLSEIGDSDSIAHTHDNAKINEICNSLNPRRSLSHEEWTRGNESSDILILHNNRSDNCATLAKLKRTMPHDLTDECGGRKCKIPVITEAVLKDEIGKTTKLREEQQYKQLESLQQSENLDGEIARLEQCHMKAHERKIQCTELVSFHKRSDSTTLRLIESNLKIDSTRDIDVYDQLQTQLLTELST